MARYIGMKIMSQSSSSPHEVYERAQSHSEADEYIEKRGEVCDHVERELQDRYPDMNWTPRRLNCAEEVFPFKNDFGQELRFTVEPQSVKVITEHLGLKGKEKRVRQTVRIRNGMWSESIDSIKSDTMKTVEEVLQKFFTDMCDRLKPLMNEMSLYFDRHSDEGG